MVASSWGKLYFPTPSLDLRQYYSIVSLAIVDFRQPCQLCYADVPFANWAFLKLFVDQTLYMIGIYQRQRTADCTCHLPAVLS